MNVATWLESLVTFQVAMWGRSPVAGTEDRGLGGGVGACFLHV